MKKLLSYIHKLFIWELIFVFFVSCIPIVWFGNNAVIMGHDSGFRPQIAFHLSNFWNSWNPFHNTGIDNTLYKGFLITQFPELAFQKILGSLENSQLFIFILWFFLILISMYILLRFLFNKKEEWLIRLSGTLIFGLNFYLLQAWFIAERAKFSLYAAMPLSILIVLLVYRKKITIISGGVLFGLLYFFLNGGSSPPLYGATITSWILLFGICSIQEMMYNKLFGFFFSFKTITFFGICFLLFNSYWIFPQISLVQSTYQSSVAREGGFSGLAAWEKEISKNATILNLLRLQGFPDWIDNASHPYSKLFTNNLILIVISFIFTTSILLAFSTGLTKILKKEQYPIFVLCLLFLVIGLPLSAGSQPPFGKFYLLAMQYIPGFAIFRSSLYKFAPLVWFAFSFLTAYSIWYLGSLINKRSIRKISYYLILIIIIFYHFPFFSAKFFSFSQTFSTRVILPDYVKKVSSDINEIVPQYGRVLLLPPLDKGFINRPIDTSTWGFYSLDVLPRSTTNKIIIANDATDSTTSLLYDSWNIKDKITFLQLSKVLGITHILFREDIEQSSLGKKTSFIREQYTQMVDFFGNPIIKNGAWSVFEVQSQQAVPYISSSYRVVNDRAKHQALLTTSSVSAIIRLINNDTKIRNQIDSFEFECQFCELNEYEEYKQHTVLPTTKFKADTFLYTLLGRRGEKTINGETRAQRIDRMLSISQKRLSELSKLEPSSTIFQTIEHEYIEAINDIKENYILLSEKEKFQYTSRLFAFLTNQEKYYKDYSTALNLLNKLNSFISDLQQSLFVSDNTKQRYITEITQKGTYIVRLFFYSGDTVSINGVVVHDKDEITLEKGIAKLELLRIQNENPIIFLEQKSLNTQPVKYVNNFTRKNSSISIESDQYSNYLLVLPETFDDRWKAMIKDEKEIISEYKHVLVNGFANGWIINSNKPHTVILYYKPYNDFILGLLVSLVSLTSGIVWLLFRIFIYAKKHI